MTSIYERIGGARGIESAVAGFYRRLLADPALKGFFARADVDQLKVKAAAFLTQALGGPADPRSVGLRTTHADLGFSEGDLARADEHLSQSLTSLGLDRATVDEIVGLAAALESDNVSGPRA